MTQLMSVDNIFAEFLISILFLFFVMLIFCLLLDRSYEILHFYAFWCLCTV